ncbi:hypothetical protein SAMN02799624_05320 [Paenibacillus sp. UNC496MF]|uniref:SAM-dependent DNA methyltransferase n=1 Tax=Paenibacillus sp. UNC496MF TaxID=1502753 RepID=UPI0008E070AA|nr:SAM-dependent DNA methyltransferase [Paenibacillus sp. UNC496MF]SFJ64096.1 hypothetical protein SAMN02799624_05320 [Paenibacillus sp. UNC496MF]
MAKKKLDKDALYRMERFTPEQMIIVQRSIYDYGQAIGGMPMHHSEVYEKRGWLLPFLFAYDDLLHGRWSYWQDILQKGTIVGSGPIPRLDFIQSADERLNPAMKMLNDCLSQHWTHGALDDFADWLLWGFAATNEPPKIDPQVNEHFYRTFDLFLVLDRPYDYLSMVLSEQTSRGYKSGLGYFPTPMSITMLMAEMTMAGSDPEKAKKQSFMEPCVGCGAIMLPMSNYVLRGFASDISMIAVKLCKIQMYWYAPWFAFHPESLQGFSDEEAIKLVPSFGGRGIVEGQLALDLVGV